MRNMLAPVFVLAIGCAAPDPIRPEPSRDAGPTPVGADASTPPPANDWQSGTRLRPQYVTGSDGSRRPWCFWDTTEKVLCDFRVARDFKLRCLPLDSDPTDPTLYVQGMIGD